MTAGDNDFWLAKLDAAGNHIWSKRFGDAQKQFVTGLADSKSGDLAIPITFAGTINFGATSIPSLSIPPDMFSAPENSLAPPTLAKVCSRAPDPPIFTS